MQLDPASLFVLFATSAITFIVARIVGRKWREKRRHKEEAAKRANESRQVRRARERNQRK